MNQKILIFGNSAAGKSTLAKSISHLINAVHVDLDTVAWKAGVTPPERRNLDEAWAEVSARIHAQPNWVIEGCYADLLEKARPHASKLIFLDLPIEECLDNARSRPWEPHKYASPQAQDRNLPMLLDWIADYERRQDTFSGQAHRRLFDSHEGEKCRLRERTSAHAVL